MSVCVPDTPPAAAVAGRVSRCEEAAEGVVEVRDDALLGLVSV